MLWAFLLHVIKKSVSTVDSDAYGTVKVLGLT